MIRKRGSGLQVQVYAGRDPLTGRKRWVSRQVPGQTKAAHRQAKKVEAELLEQVDRGEHRGSRTRTVAELIERWFTWRQQVPHLPYHRQELSRRHRALHPASPRQGQGPRDRRRHPGCLVRAGAGAWRQVPVVLAADSQA